MALINSQQNQFIFQFHISIFMVNYY